MVNDEKKLLMYHVITRLHCCFTQIVPKLYVEEGREILPRLLNVNVVFSAGTFQLLT